MHDEAHSQFSHPSGLSKCVLHILFEEDRIGLKLYIPSGRMRIVNRGVSVRQLCGQIYKTCACILLAMNIKNVHRRRKMTIEWKQNDFNEENQR